MAYGPQRVCAMLAALHPPTFVVLVMGNLMPHITGTTGIFVFFKEFMNTHYQNFVVNQIYFGQTFVLTKKFSMIL